MLYFDQSFQKFEITPETAKCEILSKKSQIRESMSSLPKSFQPFLTWLTSVPLRGQKPSQHTSIYHLLTALLTLMIGFSLCIFGYGLFGSLCSLSSMRKLQVVIVHHCSHSNFFDRKSRWNGILGNILSFILFTEPFKYYQKAHIQDHHFTQHMTTADPTVKFLFDRIGLKPGMPVKTSLKKIIFNFLSPEFYWNTWKQRFHEQDQASSFYKTSQIAYFFLVIISAIYFAPLSFLMPAYLLPLFVWYPISSTLRLAVEHTFPKDIENRKFDLGSHSYLTNAVFCGEIYPTQFFHRLEWVTKMLLIHLPTRFLILVGDTPVHDHHHRHPLYKDWPNYAYARYSEIEKNKVGYSEYREVWGFGNALRHSLESLQNQRIHQ